MKNILLFGAGRSSPSLIQYLAELSNTGNFHSTVVDSVIPENQLKNISYLVLDISNVSERQKLIQESNLIISLLPPSLHLPIAKDCVNFAKHFITASYNSHEIQELNATAIEKGICILTECGLDPGIDHMSALNELDDIKAIGGIITSFKSYTGGLVAPESDNNPWHYKITWNPKNVVLAGQGIAQFLYKNQIKRIPNQRLFSSAEKITIDGVDNLEGYPNRDSLNYLQVYNLPTIETFIRGTLRKSGFCSAWNLIVQLGLTDDTAIIKNSENLTWKEFTSSFIHAPKSKNNRHALAKLIHKGPGAQEISKLIWLGLFEDAKTGIPNATAAMLLQKKLKEKLVMKEDDKDMIVMHHIFEYTLATKKHKRTSTLILKGENKRFTAMAKTVGLPLGIAAKLILEEKIKLTGVHIPTHQELYKPILKELESHGIRFNTKEN